MNKEELIQLHTLMVHIKDFLENNGKGDFDFSEYYDLEISPLHIHRNKNDHKNAVFILGKEISSIITDMQTKDIDKQLKPSANAEAKADNKSY